MAFSLARDKVVTVFILKYNGTLTPTVLQSKFQQDLVCSRRVLVTDIDSSSEILNAVSEVITKSLIGYWGGFCWQFTELSICSYYQSLLDQRDKDCALEFSLSYVIERWGEIHVRLSSPLPGHCSPGASGSQSQYFHITPQDEGCSKEGLGHLAMTVYILAYNGITRPSVHMCVADEIPLTYVRMHLNDPRNQLPFLPNLIKHSVKKVFPEYDGGLCAVIPAKDVCHRFQELLDEEAMSSLAVACERKFIPETFFPLYSLGCCKAVYVRLTIPLTVDVDEKYLHVPFSLEVPDARLLQKQCFLQSQRKKRGKRGDKYDHTVLC